MSVSFLISNIIFKQQDWCALYGRIEKLRNIIPAIYKLRETVLKRNTLGKNAFNHINVFS